MSQKSPTDLECTIYAEAFVTNGGFKTNAFKRTFPNSKASAKILNEKACLFSKKDKVIARVEEVQKTAMELAEKHIVFSIKEAMKEYEEARALAFKLKNPTAMVSATNGKAKIAGLEKTSINLNANVKVAPSLSDFYNVEG